MKALDAAIYTALSVPAMSAATGGIHRRRAPQGTAPPYVTFEQDASEHSYTLSGEAFSEYPYLIHCVCEGLSAVTAQNLAAAAHTLLQDVALSVTGHGLMYLRRNLYTEYDEVVDGKTYQHVVTRYSIWLDPT